MKKKKPAHWLAPSAHDNTIRTFCTKSHVNHTLTPFQAIRGHWGVEANNYIRDVSFQEDKVRTKHGNQAQVLASLRTLASQLFREADLDNFQAALEMLTDCPDLLGAFLVQYGFL